MTDQKDVAISLNKRLTDGENVYIVEDIALSVGKERRNVTLDAFNAMSLTTYQPTEAELEVEKLQAIIEEKNEIIAKLKASSKTPGASSKTFHLGRKKKVHLTKKQKRVFNRFVTQGLKTPELAYRFNLSYNHASVLRNQYLKRKMAS